MNIISLNIRGIGGPAKWRYVREIISKNGVGMVCIHETKVGTINREKCSAIWGDDEYEWIDSPVENSGGESLLFRVKINSNMKNQSLKEDS